MDAVVRVACSFSWTISQKSEPGILQRTDAYTNVLAYDRARVSYHGSNGREEMAKAKRTFRACTALPSIIALLYATALMIR